MRSPFRKTAAAAALCVLAFAGTGCWSYRIGRKTPERDFAFPAAVRGSRFRIGRFEGTVVDRSESFSGTATSGIACRLEEFSLDGLNAEFARRCPSLYAEDGIPLFVRIEGLVPDISTDGLALTVLGRSRGDVEGTVRVSLYRADGEFGKGSERRVAVSYCEALTPVAWLPAGGDDLGSAFGPFESLEPVMRKALTSLVVDALLEQLARTPEGTLPADVGGTLRSKAEMERTAALDGLVVGTTDLAGGKEAAHEFSVSFTNAPGRIPAILEQNYDDATRRGFVRADLSGCDRDAALGFLERRLVPAICASKAVVTDFGAPFPEGAQARILGRPKFQEDHPDVVRIDFEQIQ